MAKTKPRADSGKRIKKSTKKSYLSQLCYALEKASAGLSHTSESDYPYRFFTLMPPGEPPTDGRLTPDTFLSSIGLSQELLDELKVPIGELIEENSFDDFFPGAQDIAGYYGLDINNRKVVSESRRYRNLEKLIRKRLHDVKVFRVGKIDIRCYIAGLTRQGNIAGLVTTSIET